MQILRVLGEEKKLKEACNCHYGKCNVCHSQMDRVKRIWYLSPMRAAKVQASLRIRAVSPEPSLFAHTSSESRGTVKQKAISLDPLNGWACAVKICHDGMLEDTNSLDGAQTIISVQNKVNYTFDKRFDASFVENIVMLQYIYQINLTNSVVLATAKVSKAVTSQ